MLTEEEIKKLSNIQYNTHSVIMYWHMIQRQPEMSKKQLRTLQSLAKMNKDEQDTYVIIEDELVLAPTNKKTHEIPVIR